MTRRVTIGKVTSPHGVRGWVKVISLTDNPDRFETLEKITLSGGRKNVDLVLGIEGLKYQADRILVKFEGIDSREDAGRLRNRELQIPESDVAPIGEKDTYYFYQLEGMVVQDRDGEELGRLASVLRTGSNDVYIVRGADEKKEYMVPALKKCVLSVDVEKGIMVVDRAWVT